MALRPSAMDKILNEAKPQGQNSGRRKQSMGPSDDDDEDNYDEDDW